MATEVSKSTKILRLDSILEREWARHGHSKRFEKLLLYQESMLVARRAITAYHLKHKHGAAS